jgi:hypothetical protein
MEPARRGGNIGPEVHDELENRNIREKRMN